MKRQKQLQVKVTCVNTFPINKTFRRLYHKKKVTEEATFYLQSNILHTSQTKNNKY